MNGLWLAGCWLGCMGCGALTREEARDAMEEMQVASMAQALTSGSVEITTDFTIGDAVDQAAETIAEFIRTNLPCSEITLDGASLRVEYGAVEGDCTFRGQTYSGVHEVTVVRTGAAEVEVTHEWTELANQMVRVSGEATVTWDADARTRRVVHSLDWTRLADGRSATGSGDRTQRALDGDIGVGFQVDGMRAWEGESGEFTLDIEGAQMRWVDPVPQAGRYVLDTPYDKRLVATFERVDDDTIGVTLKTGARQFTFEVASTGAIEDTK